MEVIAERELVLQKDGSKVEVAVRLGRPESIDGNWKCPYEIWVGDSVKSMAMHGTDSMQALQLSLATLDVELEYISNQQGGRLYYLDEPFKSMLEHGGLQKGAPADSA